MKVSWAVAAGIAIGAAYTLSPLTVLCLALLIVVTRWVGRDLSGRERRWFYALVSFAIASRLIVIAALFLQADASTPYATFFGDEAIFKSRPIWLRNLGLGVPISSADVIYAYDETGMSGYLYVLAFVQALVGDAPYGVHVLNVAAYMTGALLLFRLVRPSYGPVVAIGGLAVLMFLPSLFSWSVSALKEPVYTLLTASELTCAMAIVRARRVWVRAASVAAVALLALALEEVRKGALIVASIGTLAGVAAGWMLVRPRLALAAGIALPIAAAAGLSVPAVQERLLDGLRVSVRYHTGHVLTPGISYKIVDHPYYGDWKRIQAMPAREAGAFAVAALGSYFVEPLPDNVQSRALWAYLPEQAIWLLIVLAVPFGIAGGLKRDATLTGVLAAHAAAVIVVVALTSGNIGTLIRHRGLSIPYLIWLAMLAACALAARLAPAPVAAIEGTHAHADR